MTGLRLRAHQPASRLYKVIGIDMAIGNSLSHPDTHTAAVQIIRLAKKVGKLFVCVDNRQFVYAVPANSERARLLEEGYPIGIVGVFDRTVLIGDLIEAIGTTIEQLTGQAPWARKRGRPAKEVAR